MIADLPDEEPRGPLFPLGKLLITPGASSVLSNEDITSALRRHLTGDWGDLDEEDRQENELSLREGYRMLSAYQTANDIRFWIITEADRSATTILLPEEY